MLDEQSMQAAHHLSCILQLVGHHLFSALWSDRTWGSHSNLLVGRVIRVLQNNN